MHCGILGDILGSVNKLERKTNLPQAVWVYSGDTGPAHLAVQHISGDSGMIVMIVSKPNETSL